MIKRIVSTCWLLVLILLFFPGCNKTPAPSASPMNNTQTTTSPALSIDRLQVVQELKTRLENWLDNNAPTNYGGAYIDLNVLHICLTDEDKTEFTALFSEEYLDKTLQPVLSAANIAADSAEAQQYRKATWVFYEVCEYSLAQLEDTAILVDEIAKAHSELPMQIDISVQHNRVVISVWASEDGESQKEKAEELLSEEGINTDMLMIVDHSYA